MPPKALDSAALFRDIRCESPCVSAQEWLWFERRAWRPQEQETPAASFDHLVGAGEKRWRDGEVERFGGFEIDNKLKSRGLLKREGTRMRTIEDACDITGTLPFQLTQVRTIRNQAPGFGEEPKWTNERQHALKAQLGDRFGIGSMLGVSEYEHAISTIADGGGERMSVPRSRP